MSFASLNLNASILQAVTAAGYTATTPVQAKSIPQALAGQDLMCSAPTGTGKTAAFVLPALQKLLQPAKPGRGPRVLVLTPTRELAMQVTSAVEKYSKFMPRVRTGTVLGGMPYPKQRRLLEMPLDILVATPGRLIDFIDQGKVDFSRLELLILDEASSSRWKKSPPRRRLVVRPCCSRPRSTAALRIWPNACCAIRS